MAQEQKESIDRTFDQFMQLDLGLGGNRCKVFEKSKYFDSESVTSLITSLKAISRNLISHIAKQYLEKDSIKIGHCKVGRRVDIHIHIDKCGIILVHTLLWEGF